MEDESNNHTTATHATSEEEATTRPEAVLRRRKDLDLLRAKREERLLEQKRKKHKPIQKIQFRRLEEFIKENRKTEGSRRRADRILTRYTVRENQVSNNPAENVAFVIRCRGQYLDKKTAKFLKVLRLGRINTGVFMRLTATNLKILKVIEPFIAYGRPNLKTIQELILRRGFVRVENKRLPITDNKLIEDNLGSYGIICVDDIIQEIFQNGPHFKQVTKFLCPFRLSKSQFKREIAIEDFKLSPGYHDQKINEIVQYYA